jgi:hypothetical protein
MQERQRKCFIWKEKVAVRLECREQGFPSGRKGIEAHFEKRRIVVACWVYFFRIKNVENNPTKPLDATREKHKY